MWWFAYGDGTGAAAMVVAAEEVSAGPDDHVAGGDGDVGVPAEVVWRVGAVGDELAGHFFGRDASAGALAVVDAVVEALAERDIR